MIDAGTIVTPIDVTAERIVGIVTGGWNDMATVIWVSDSRGVLSCTEALSDITVCDVNEAQADNVSRELVADLLGGI